jgi:protein TonB
VALVVAVALSPIIIEKAPVLAPLTGTLIEIEKPKPPETKPEVKPSPRSNTPTEAVRPLVDTFPPAGRGFEVKPVVPDPLPYDPGPTTVRPADPPKPPPLVLAELDQRFAGSFQPDYPASEQRREIEGSAKVRVLIGTDGRVKAVELVSTDSPGFFAETKRRALAKWRFKPATRGGVAEESWKVMVVHFQIRNG